MAELSEEIGPLPEGMTAERLRAIAKWLDTYDAIVERVIFTMDGDDVLTGEQLNAVRGKDVQGDLRRWADVIEAAESGSSEADR